MTEDTRSNSDSHNADNQTAQRPWRGIAEIDKAIHENRLTEYRWKKAWADPWTRRAWFFIILLFAAFTIFVVYQDIIKY
jgi:hypothetical protein